MSITAVTKPNGGKQTGTSYWSFGETQSTTGTPVTRLKYTGREDDGTGLYYYRNRYYDPRIGRFASEDPKGFEAGINFYAYCNNGPIDCNDPSGNIGVGVAGAAIGTVIGGGASFATQLYQNNGDISKVNWNNVGWSAATGGVAGILLTTPAGGSLSGIAGIGALTNLFNYGLTTSPSDYSLKGAAISALSGAAGGLVGGKAPNPYMFINPSPRLNDIGLIGKMVAPKVLGMGVVGGIVGAIDYLKDTPTITSTTSTSPALNSSFKGSFNDMINSNSAATGSVIYPNSPNQTQLRGVYAK